MTEVGLVSELVQGGYLKTPTLIEAFGHIDRASFVTEDHKSEAYENKPLPIGFDQTISQPLTVAFMLELLQAQPGDKILDIGSGSGWQTAILAYLVGDAGKVVAIERISELKDFADKNISGYEDLAKRISNSVGDGSVGFPSEAPYDRIIAAAATEAVPNEWKEQLKIGGVIVAPIGQSIVVVHKITADKFEEKNYFGFSFVPLVKGS